MEIPAFPPSTVDCQKRVDCFLYSRNRLRTARGKCSRLLLLAAGTPNDTSEGRKNSLESQTCCWGEDTRGSQTSCQSEALPALFLLSSVAHPS